MEHTDISELVTAPVYLQIALDVASRIERGELAEKSKLYGRSVMSSEYGVSPETIRRSLKLLSDMGVVDVQHNSGAVVLSREKASQYVARFSEYTDVKIRRKKLQKMMHEHIQQTRAMMDLVNEITGADDRVSRSNPFRNYEIDIPENSSVIGKTIGELQF
ncbi:MAG TPA: GntR family transcriptional regulator, partial [Treponemataceae bacterium]|nr:GntR family transcriptional regulator [Treponemataceae bacterium]